MTKPKSNPASRIPRRRWESSIIRAAVLAPMAYGVWRIAWAIGIPIGIDAHSLHHDLHCPGLGSLGILALLVLTEGTALYTHILIGGEAQTVPRWVPVLARRRVRPLAAIAPLLLPIGILTYSNGWSVAYVADGFRMPSEVAESLPSWSFWGQMAIFWAWGISLTAAVIVYWRGSRPGSARGLRSQSSTSRRARRASTRPDVPRIVRVDPARP